MGRTKRSDRLAELEAEPLPPKKRRGKAEPRPLSELQPIAEPPALPDPLHRDQKSQVEDARAEQPPPQLDIPVRMPVRNEDADDLADMPFSRPLGPRKREVGEPFNIVAGKHVRVSRTDKSFILTTTKELTDQQWANLNSIGMREVSKARNSTEWQGPRTAEATYRIQAIAMDIEGKDMGRVR
jgi:hypothetical protein